MSAGVVERKSLETFFIELWDGWAKRGGTPAARRSRHDDVLVLEMNRRYRFAVVLGTTVFTMMWAVILIGMAISPPKGKYALVLVGSILAASVAVSVSFLIYVYSYRVELSRDAFTLLQPFHSSRRIEWNEITQIRYGVSNPHIHITTNYATVRISPYLNGLSAFRRGLAHYAPRNFLEEFWQQDQRNLELSVTAWNCTQAELNTPPFP